MEIEEWIQKGPTDKEFILIHLWDLLSFGHIQFYVCLGVNGSGGGSRDLLSLAFFFTLRLVSSTWRYFLILVKNFVRWK